MGIHVCLKLHIMKWLPMCYEIHFMPKDKHHGTWKDNFSPVVAHFKNMEKSFWLCVEGFVNTLSCWSLPLGVRYLAAFRTTFSPKLTCSILPRKASHNSLIWGGEWRVTETRKYLSNSFISLNGLPVAVHFNQLPEAAENKAFLGAVGQWWHKWGLFINLLF